MNSQGRTVNVYTDGSVLQGQRSGWGFSARVMGKVSTQQSGGYQIITSIASLKIKASSTALKWLSNTHLARAIIIFDAQFVLSKGVGWGWWVVNATIHNSLKLEELLWIYCPERAGVRGNERADSLSWRASITQTLKVDRVLIGSETSTE